MMSSETENFYRLISLLVDTATDVLRKLFQTYALMSATSIDDFLYRSQGQVFQLQKQRVLRQDQITLLSPSPSSGLVDLKAWDITLLYTLLRNLCSSSVSSTVMTEVESVRNIRNTVYGHTKEATLPDADFNKHWSSLESAIKVFLQTCGDAAFEKTTLEHIREVKEGPLDIGSTIQLLRDWYSQDRKVEQKLDGITDKLDQLTLDVTGLAMKKPPPNPVLEKLKKQSQLMLEEIGKVSHVSTSVYVQAGQLLDTHGVVTVLAGSGDGKTLCGVTLMTSRSSPDKCLIVQDASQWEHVDTTQIDVVLLDDIFGQHRFNTARFDSWRPVLDLIQTAITAGDLKVIITSTRDCFAECETELTRYDMFDHRIYCMSSCLSLEEKTKILQSTLKHYGKDEHISEVEISNCCQAFGIPFGFPLCCKMFALDGSILMKMEAFFQRPFTFIETLLPKMKKESLVSMIFLFYKNNSCQDRQLRHQRHAESHSDLDLLHFISGCVGEGESLPEVRLPTVKQHLHYLTGTFVKHENNTYSFLHYTLYECLALYHAKNYPDEVIEVSSTHFLSNCISTKDAGTLNVLRVTERYFQNLASRLVLEIMSGNSITEILTHSSFQDSSFCKELIQWLSEKEKLKEFFCQGNTEDTFFLVKFIEHNRSSDTFIKAALTELQCDHSSAPDEENCWKCKVKVTAMSSAVAAGHQETFQIMQEAGVTIPKTSQEKTETD